MEIAVKRGEVGQETAEVVVLPLFEGVKRLPAPVVAIDRKLGRVIHGMLGSGEFSGKPGQVGLFPSLGRIPAGRILLVGLGKEGEFDLERLRKGAGMASCAVRDHHLSSYAIDLTSLTRMGRSPLAPGELARAWVEGSMLSLYQFSRYKTVDRKEFREIKRVTLLAADRQVLAEVRRGATVGQTIARAVNFTRDLISSPSRDLTPTILARRATDMARQSGLICRVLGPQEIKRLRMGCLLGVAQGSKEPPRFLVLEYRPPRPAQTGRRLVFVGKAITFDSGGISIKPSEGMDRMKYDMSGGAAVLGALKAAADLKLPHHLIGLVPATENMPSGSAYKPGDILTSHAGKTVEVLNTDAEGRLILADALSYARRYRPAAVIDLATLTGACVVALGHFAIAMMGHDDRLKARVRQAGERSGERVWELPLWQEYYDQIKSDIADVKNVGGKPAGTITAGAFLGRFAEGYPWVHLDIAGTAWHEENHPYLKKGATGVGVRLLTQLLLDWDKGPEAG